MLSCHMDCLPKSDQRLDASQFLNKFQALFSGLKYSILKYEALQSYQEPENDSYVAWVRGDRAESVKLIGNNIARESELFIQCSREGIQFVRLRPVQLPLTSYLEWEFHTYQISARYGQKILIADLADPDTSKLLNRGSDFLIFDDKSVLAHDYNREGLLRGGWFIEDHDKVRVYRDFFQAALKTAVPLGVFERLHGLA